jgi:hypothetical protein
VQARGVGAASGISFFNNIDALAARPEFDGRWGSAAHDVVVDGNGGDYVRVVATT